MSEDYKNNQIIRKDAKNCFVETNPPAIVRRTELTSTYLSKNCWSCAGNYLAEN